MVRACATSTESVSTPRSTSSVRPRAASPSVGTVEHALGLGVLVGLTYAVDDAVLARRDPDRWALGRHPGLIRYPIADKPLASVVAHAPAPQTPASLPGSRRPLPATWESASTV